MLFLGTCIQSNAFVDPFVVHRGKPVGGRGKVGAASVERVEHLNTVSRYSIIDTLLHDSNWFGL